MAGLKKAVVWNSLSQFGQSGIQFLSTIILVRLLTPDDFGVIGMVTIFITLGTMMVDSEMGGALLRKKEVTNTDYSTLFYYNLGISIILYLILFIFAPFISELYSRPFLTDVIRVIGIAIIIHAFRVVQQVMIFRSFDFKYYAVISVTSGVLSLLITIYLAHIGWGYWAIVAQTIIYGLLNVVLMSVKNRFLPTAGFSISSFKEQFGFGIKLLGADTLKVIANNISLNIIAKFAPLSVTGNYTQYSRVTSFSQNFLSSIMNQSVFPVLAQEKDIDILYAKYLRMLKYLCLGLLIFVLIISELSGIIISLLLGDEYIDYKWMFNIISLTIIPTTLMVLSRNILKALGDTATVLRIESVKTAVVLITLFAAIPVGLKAIVWSVAIGQTISAVYCYYKTDQAFNKSAVYNMAMFICISVLSYMLIYITL
ncbi:lipopolysaccharide biosynthesis protein [Parabacteroides sp. ZJ-118]|uniref:lipopolysaccharide biosynthesis protein n=1 Tax=Parabacteroides sp. ZJ-118 TaxID=2709398 RepID=UPI0013ED729D|nr:lipopolysaccharide biosynthesis protein [Parabacteroides sp. ZJ-118]